MKILSFLLKLSILGVFKLCLCEKVFPSETWQKKTTFIKTELLAAMENMLNIYRLGYYATAAIVTIAYIIALYALFKHPLALTWSVDDISHEIFS